ncbi:MAG: cytochrome c1 [Pseudomonadota bacterium]
MRNFLTAAFAAAMITAGGSAWAAGGAGKVSDVDFPFDGPFGTYDEDQLQRGLQVYTEICSACHGLRQVAFRTLTDLGYTDDQIKAYIDDNGFEVFDAELDDFRPAAISDHFPEGALENAPDLSMMAKARAGFHGPYGLGLNQFWYGMGGPEYIKSLLTGYTGNDKEEAGVILYENTAYPGGWISMGPPLYGDDVDYADGHSTEIADISKDVSAFLMWTAEPKLPQRKTFGMVSVAMLTILAILLYFTNKRLWAPIKRKDGDGR